MVRTHQHGEEDVEVDDEEDELVEVDIDDKVVVASGVSSVMVTSAV